MVMRCKNTAEKRWVNAVAAVLILYVLLDVSFLQQYCGIEALGIPPTGVAAKQAKLIAPAAPVNLSASSAGEESSEHDSQDPIRDESCFCCCSHVTQTVVFSSSHSVRRTLTAYQPTNFPVNSLFTESHLSTPYQPPKFS